MNKFAKILLHAQALQISHLDVLKNRLAENETRLNEVNPSKDQDLYIEYNIRPFSAPSDWKFEPCATFYDNVSHSLSHEDDILYRHVMHTGGNECRAGCQDCLAEPT